MKTKTLSDIIQAFTKKHPKALDAGVDGYCDTFALCLMEQLQRCGVESELLLISRKRFNRRGNTVEKVALSHVTVIALDESWDVYGKDASERWEVEWKQFSDCDEMKECDEFDYKGISREALINLREKVDSESYSYAIAPREDYRAAFTKALAPFFDAHVLKPTTPARRPRM